MCVIKITNKTPKSYGVAYKVMQTHRDSRSLLPSERMYHPIFYKQWHTVDKKEFDCDYASDFPGYVQWKVYTAVNCLKKEGNKKDKVQVPPFGVKYSTLLIGADEYEPGFHMYVKLRDAIKFCELCFEDWYTTKDTDIVIFKATYKGAIIEGIEACTSKVVVAKRMMLGDIEYWGK